MKRIILFSGSMLAVSTLFCACAHDEADAFAPAGKTVSRTFFLADTRTDYFPEENAIHFGDDEELTPFVWAADAAYANLATAKSVKRNTDGTATVDFTGDETGVYNFGFVSPASNGAQCDGSSYDVTLPGEQYPAADGSCFDRSCDVLVSRVVQENVEPVLFKRMFGFLKLTIAKSQLEGIGADERVYSVSFATGNSVALTGAATVPVTDDAAKCVPEFVTSSNKVAAVYPDGAAFDADGNLTVWFVVNPVAFEGATVEVKTSAHVYRAEYDAAAWSAALDPAKINTVAGLEFTPAEAYTAVVDGKVYSSNDEGAKTLTVAADATADTEFFLNGKSGVYFLENKSADYVFVDNGSSNAVMKDLIIIGVGEPKVEYKLTKNLALRNNNSANEGILMFKNLVINAESITNYVMNLGGATASYPGMKRLVFEDCEIRLAKPLLTFNNANPDAGVEDIVIRNCKIRYTEPKNAMSGLVYISPTTKNGALVCKQFVFDNNIVYWPGFNASAPNGFSVFYYQKTTSAGDATVPLSNLHVICTRNTFYNAIGMSQYATFSFALPVASFEYDRNIMYTDDTAKYPFALGINSEISDWSSYVLPKTDNIYEGSKGYKLYNTGTGWFYPEADKSATFAKKSGIFTNVDVENGVFEKNPAYADYGSTLE